MVGSRRVFWSVTWNCTVQRKRHRRFGTMTAFPLPAFLRRPGHMPNPLHLYDNYTRSPRPFEPLVANGEIGLYTCGPTVYDYQHIGNYRTFIFEDLLKRVLEWNGYRVCHVMNITDVGHLTSVMFITWQTR